MAITSYPFENQDTSETQYSLLFRELQDSGVADSFGAPGFAVTANASGMQVIMQPGFAIVRGHAVHSTSTETVRLDPPEAAVRIDRIVLRLDPAANAVAPAVVKGVPGADAPALTQTDTGIFELPLARVQVDVGVGSIAGDKVTDDRPYVGARIGVWSTRTRPSGFRTYKLGYNTSIERWEFWNGTQWQGLKAASADNAGQWNGYELIVSASQPSVAPLANRIWIQPTA